MPQETKLSDFSHPHKACDLWRQGYRPFRAKIVLEDEMSGGAGTMIKLEELDLAPNFPVIKAFLRAWAESGRPPVHHVEVTERDDCDRDALEAASISTLVH